MGIFATFFGTVITKDIEKKGMLEIPKKLPKTGVRFTATSDLQNNEELVLFEAGNRSLSRKFSDMQSLSSMSR